MMTRPVDFFKALGDGVRLRIVRAVSQAELSVAELVAVLGLPQSTVSRHLKPLRDTQLLEARRDGTSVYYRRGTAFADHILKQFVEDQVQQIEKQSEDHAAVRLVLDQRKIKSREFFDRMAGRYSALTEPGGGWPSLALALAAGFRGQWVADLGAGEGALTLMLSKFAAGVTAVDASPEMLRLVREQVDAAGYGDRVTLAEGDLESLPLPDTSFDAVFLSQALHHAAQPAVALKEASRILKKQGLLVLLDLAKHDQDWARDEWADQWLGFTEEDVRKWTDDAGVEIVHMERLTGTTPELAVLIMIGTKSKK